MNILFSALGFLLIVNAETDGQRTIGAVLAGAGVNDVLREHRDSAAVAATT